MHGAGPRTVPAPLALSLLGHQAPLLPAPERQTCRCWGGGWAWGNCLSGNWGGCFLDPNLLPYFGGTSGIPGPSPQASFVFSLIGWASQGDRDLGRERARSAPPHTHGELFTAGREEVFGCKLFCTAASPERARPGDAGPDNQEQRFRKIKRWASPSPAAPQLRSGEPRGRPAGAQNCGCGVRSGFVALGQAPPPAVTGAPGLGGTRGLRSGRSGVWDPPFFLPPPPLF